MLEDLGVANVQDFLVIARGGDSGIAVAISVVGGGARVLVGGLLFDVDIVDVVRHCERY